VAKLKLEPVAEFILDQAADLTLEYPAELKLESTAELSRNPHLVVPGLGYGNTNESGHTDESRRP